MSYNFFDLTRLDGSSSSIDLKVFTKNGEYLFENSWIKVLSFSKLIAAVCGLYTSLQGYKVPADNKAIPRLNTYAKHLSILSL
jgi:hypothetical protein